VGEVLISQESSPLHQWWDRITKSEENFGRWDFAALVIFDRRFQPPKSYFQAYAMSPAIVGPLRDLETKVGVWLKENKMPTYGDYVGADNGSSYPEVAARAVGDANRQNPSPAYGYFRAPVQGPQVGGPWVDLMGAEMDVREQRRAWLHTRGLIESAKRKVIDAQARTPAAGAFIGADGPSARAERSKC
jgi:hypothetical protein